MTKIKITLIESHTHTVEMDDPCFFMIKEVYTYGIRFKFMRVYNTPDGNRYDAVTMFDERFEKFEIGRLFDADTKTGDPISAEEYLMALDQAQDEINDQLIAVRRLTSDSDEMSEEDEAFENRLDRADAYNDEMKFKVQEG
jgi:hypothetical protein